MIDYDLKKIRGLAFDVDGVLSASNVWLLEGTTQPCRTANIKDGYAMQLAAKSGLQLAIITGGRSEAVRVRYENLGVPHIYLGASFKAKIFEQWLAACNLNAEEVIYMGDDIPDFEVMHLCGPADAAPEIRALSRYVSPLKGGYGCVRDVLEQVLRVQGKWMSDAEAFGW